MKGITTRHIFPLRSVPYLPVQQPLLEDCKLFETLFEGDMATQAKEEWEKAMSELAQEEPELLQHFQKLSEAAGKVGKANHMVVLIIVLIYYFVTGSVSSNVVVSLCRHWYGLPARVHLLS